MVPADKTQESPVEPAKSSDGAVTVTEGGASVTAEATVAAVVVPAAASAKTENAPPAPLPAASDEAKKSAGASATLVGPSAAQKLVNSALGALKATASLPLLLFTADLGTRLLLLAFLASIGLVVLASVRLIERFAPHSEAPSVAKEAHSDAHKASEQEKELAIATDSLVFLEKFSTSVQSKSGAIHLMEFELFVESEKSETGQLIKMRLAEVREIVAGTIQNHSYEKLVTSEGKDELKREILDRINQGLKKWGPAHIIKRVYFTQFVMT